ncbi:MAG TPA: 2-dehydropantoate 2-reductase [Syntrophorhabdaceae bacterium]|nr:2-dehydropantoate 2-reductase [Syntrophorhabdaceae bacterium]
MNIGIIGTGGVGGYFGGKICRLASPPDINVFFVARGGHLEEIRKNGLYISTASEGEWMCRPTLATDRISDLPTLDICLLCVKSYDLDRVTIQLSGRISESTIIVPLLNGVDIYERIRVHLKTGRVYPSCVYVGTHIERYGRIKQDGGACKILMGADPLYTGPRPLSLFEIFNRSGIACEWSDNVYTDIWGKYIFISAFGLVTAAFDKTLGEIMESEMLSRYVLSVMKEIVLIANKMGFALPETIVTDSYQKGHNFPYETKTSFQRDIEALEKPDERDLFGGTIVRLGLRMKLATPVTEELFNVIESRKSTSKTN